MITDKNEIRAAAAAVAKHGGDICVPVIEDAFHKLCPDPQWCIHIKAMSAPKAKAALRRELAEADPADFRAAIRFIRGEALTMRELDELLEMMPSGRETRTGYDSRRPSGGEIELFVFVQ